MNKEKFEELKERYGDRYLEDTEAEIIDDNDFEDWYLTYKHELENDDVKGGGTK
tara:strand:+ start:438 stop:599 length:162 start_codon:yes stop_codon:yes gene_type:complete